MTTVTEGLGFGGWLKFYERAEGAPESAWRQALEASNIVVNDFYDILFDVMGQVIQATSTLLVPNVLGLGYGISPSPARTDTTLLAEWSNPVALLSTGLANSTPYTSLACTAGCPVALASGTTLQLDPPGGGQVVTTSSATVAGATSIPVVSFTTTRVYAIGTQIGVTTASWTPQRLPLTIGSVNTADPPSVTLSYYLTAAANAIPITFTEAMLYCNGASLTPLTANDQVTHAAFSYTKNTNTDLRIDYTLTRSLT